MGALAGRGLGSRIGRTKSRLRHKSNPERSVGRPINTSAWRKARAAFIREKTLEAAERGDVLRCVKTNVPLIGTYPAPNSPVIDHIEADRGDLSLFWDRANWQIVSKEWHDAIKQAQEKGGAV